MRYYNVYFYNSCPVEQNTENFPSYWIWKMIKCNKLDAVPENATRMSLTEINSYKANNKVSMNAWVEQKVNADVHADRKVKKAIKAVNSLINKFCAENMVLGITQANKTKLLADAFKDVIYYSQTGSLYECLYSLEAITVTPEMSPFLTASRKQELKDKINNILDNL